MIVLVSVLESSHVQPAEAIGVNVSLQQTLRNILNLDSSSLTKPDYIKIDSDIESKIIIPSFSNSSRSVKIRTKSDLQNSQWLKEFICTIRGGDNENLIKSIISKVSEDDWDIPNINKILKN